MGYYNRRIRQNSLRKKPCDCGVHKAYSQRTIHAPWCSRISAMRSLLEMWGDNVIIESISIKSKNERLYFSSQDSKLGYWDKDNSTGEWYLVGVEKEISDSNIIPMYFYQEEKERKHG